MISLVYVSQSRIDPADRARSMNDILTISLARNTMLGITGLLIASPDHFAQLMEGPACSVAAVMSSIMADSRHTACRIIRQPRITKTICPHWRIARFDFDNFGTDVIDPLLMAALAGTDTQAIHRLERLIETVAADPEPVRNYRIRR